MYKDLYYVEIFVPTDIFNQAEIGYNDTTIVKKIGIKNNLTDYECLKSKIIYNTQEELLKNNYYCKGKKRITKLIPLDKCFNILGILNNSEISVTNKKYIKKLKKELKIRP